MGDLVPLNGAKEGGEFEFLHHVQFHAKLGGHEIRKDLAECVVEWQKANPSIVPISDCLLSECKGQGEISPPLLGSVVPAIGLILVSHCHKSGFMLFTVIPGLS